MTTACARVNQVLAHSQAGAVMDELERDLVGLAPIKARIRDIAALLVIDKLRMNLGLAGASAEPAHVVHRQSRHRQDHGGAAHGGDPASTRATCAKATWWR